MSTTRCRTSSRLVPKATWWARVGRSQVRRSYSQRRKAKPAPSNASHNILASHNLSLKHRIRSLEVDNLTLTTASLKGICAAFSSDTLVWLEMTETGSESEPELGVETLASTLEAKISSINDAGNASSSGSPTTPQTKRNVADQNDTQ
ncbi:hypothetical protein K443DRAFT_411 [Laccaria amethystina LaAM-08-1]|uniref:Uncharacterized protein n=1 Tax=Laccaria amethystina LaAM-08-1 TaxID=1095629 RepID=A0A0C9YP53_9AGAR|nr:hypothetical protein K443DRAFT_411 [Laccaria amethystina LaAM-08-1]